MDIREMRDSANMIPEIRTAIFDATRRKVRKELLQCFETAQTLRNALKVRFRWHRNISQIAVQEHANSCTVLQYKLKIKKNQNFDMFQLFVDHPQNVYINICITHRL